MNTYNSRIIALVLITISVIGCSRKKDKFINRTWHSMTAKNNTLYNGSVAFEEGKQEIVDTYKDNFWKLLPVERLEIIDQIIYGNEAQNENFKRSEEKASKSIQKHSMNIQGRERNPKMAKSFLLLGESRYYDQRFIPAIEAFNYILYKYPTSNVINYAKAWRAKTNIRLDNNELAINNLEKLLKDELEYMKDQDYANIAATLAQGYINLGIKDTALAYIKSAAENTRVNEERGRYNYIKGQLYNSLEQKDSANLAFDEVIELNRRIPRKYMINAYLEKARNFDYETGDRLVQLELLDKLEKNYENKAFLDKIYYHKALYYRTIDSLELADVFYKKSLRTESEDEYLQSLNYETLATMNFDNSEYAIAGAYLDSTLERLDQNSKRYRTLKKKRDNLDDVILYEGIAKVNDSILTIAAMPKEVQLVYYTRYADSLKAATLALLEKEEIQALRDALPAGQQFNNTVKSNGPNQDAGKFYFYIPAVVSKGKLSFRRKFGDRTLEDNWKISSLSDNGKNRNEEEEIKEDEVLAYDVDTDPTFNPETYISEIPTDPKILDSLSRERNFAYYQLGVIYKEKFQEYDRASRKLEALLISKPEERLILPSKYYLYKIYELQEDEEKREKYKIDIVTNHADSRYAAILLNPNEALAADEGSPDALYKNLYQDFEAGDYNKVLEFSDRYITRFTGMDIVPKFELLKAQTIGRIKGTGSYKQALNFVALNYPQSDEGKKAQEMYDELIPRLETVAFKENAQEEARKYKLLYSFPLADNAGVAATQKNIDDVIKELRYGDFKTSIDTYDGEKQFVVVHSRRNKDGTLGFAELLSNGKIEDTRNKEKEMALAKKRKRRYKKKYYPAVESTYIGISSTNYRTLHIQKNLDEYMNFIAPVEETNENKATEEGVSPTEKVKAKEKAN